jgi:hypothetical protein
MSGSDGHRSRDRLDLVLRAPQELNPDNRTIRMLGTWDAPYFCLKDLCAVLGDIPVARAKNRVDEEDRQVFTIVTAGGPQKLTYVTESGFYDVVMTSRSERVRPFQRWVTKEVLPSIRRWGCYPPPPAGDIRRLRPRPWSERFEASFRDHRRFLIQWLPPGSFSVLSGTLTEIILMEDVLIEHLLPLRAADLPDGSMGKMWAKFRREQDWPDPEMTAPLCLPDRGIEVEVKVYDASEFQEFQRWLWKDYFPEHLPIYLGRKFDFRQYGLAAPSTADLACRQVTGLPARIPAADRAAIEAAGGIIRAPVRGRVSGGG